VETTDLLKKVRRIEIKSRGLSQQIFSGEYHSAFKGSGMAFSEVREYVPGDDIRKIDWNVTARFNQPYVKLFEEERELTVMLLVDISNSANFGSHKQLKREVITEIAAVLAFSAITNNDKIGCIFFSEGVDKFIPPKKGKTHTLRIIRELLEVKPSGGKTDLAAPLQFLNNVIRKRCISFVISDFYHTADSNWSLPLQVARRKHDLVGLRIFDPMEKTIPNLGIVPIQDAESGEIQWINTSSASGRKAFEKASFVRFEKLQETLRKSGVDMATLRTDRSYIPELMQLFKRRESKR